MTIFEIIILAIIQGITEFLPISSSAHLLLPEVFLGWQAQGLAFDVAVHVGSLLAVMIYFRRDITAMTIDWFAHGFTRQQTANSKLAWCVVIGTIPAVVLGFVFKDWIELNARTGLVIAATTILFGLLLWYADARASLSKTIKSKTIKSKTINELTFTRTVIIGLAQAVALIPGTSRSGITMTAALMLGFDRESAARFSFLLSIPVILGAGLLATVDLIHQDGAIAWLDLAMGAAFSFVAAYACISLFLTWINRIGMLPFVIYRLLLGVILLLLLL